MNLGIAAFFLLAFLGMAIFGIIFAVFFVKIAKKIFRVHADNTKLMNAVQYLASHLNDQEVGQFIVLLQGIPTLLNVPETYGSLRGIFYTVNHSPTVSKGYKIALKNALLNKDVRLGNVGINMNDAEKEQMQRESGARGEALVQEKLSRLPRDQYVSLHGLHIPYPDHFQEIDSLVIGPKCVFHIETKNYGGASGGVLFINASGGWFVRKPNGSLEAKENPIGQLKTHDAALKQYLKAAFPDREIDVKGMIVISNPNTIIEGNENAPYAHRFDMMNLCIEDYKGPYTIDEELRNAICLKLSALKSDGQPQYYSGNSSFI